MKSVQLDMFDKAVQQEVKPICTFEWMHSTGFINDIVDWIKQFSQQSGLPIAALAAGFKLDRSQCKRLGIPYRKSDTVIAL